MKAVHTLLSSIAMTTMIACSGGGGGGGSAPSTGGGGNGGDNGGSNPPPAASYVGYEYSTTQVPLPISGVAADFNTNRTLLGDKALIDLTDAGTYHMNLLVGDSECVNDLNSALYNKTYSMVMVKSEGNSTHDPTWAVVTVGTQIVSGFTIDALSFAAVKSTATPSTMITTTDSTNTGTDGGATLPHVNLADVGWSCSNGKATFTGGWEFVGNDTVLLVKSPTGSLYLGFSNNVTLSSLAELSGKSMEQYSFLFSLADNYNDCPSICNTRANSTWNGAQSGVMFSGSPLSAVMPQVGDQSPEVVSVSLSSANTVSGNNAYAPAASATAKFSILDGTGNMMGSGPGHGGRILGVAAKFGSKYISIFTHQYRTSQQKGDINNGLGAVILSVTP